MKKSLLVLWMMFICLFGFSQYTVESIFIDNSNTLNSQFHFLTDEDISQDLFFSIGPNGLPQYGQSVSWNLAAGTRDKARFYHVKKGDWDREAIQTQEQDINFLGSANINPVNATPNIDMESNWIKLGKSWNFTRDNYAVAIVSFTNQGEEKIESGRIRFSHPDNIFIDITDIYIYNEWVKLLSTETESGMKVYEFEYNNLEPREIRHLYVEVDIAKSSMIRLPRIDLYAEMVGYQNTQLISQGIIPPHDPNALYLINALENTDTDQNCASYSEYPALEEACNLGKPFWVKCSNPGDSKCPEAHSLNYPYCNIDSELLTYKITCLNDGEGYAKDVEMLNVFDVNSSPFINDIFDYFGTHDVNGGFDYPEVRFTFEDINLPGLNDEHTVYTYDECSAAATFTLKTKCYQKEKIDAQAAITFFDMAGNSVGDVLTNYVTIVPEQGVYTNYTPECISCKKGKRSASSPSTIKDISLSWTNSTLNVSFDRDQEDAQTSMQLIDISGRLIIERTISPNGNIRINEQLDISNLTSGIYFISIQNGDKNHVEKLVRY